MFDSSFRYVDSSFHRFVMSFRRFVMVFRRFGTPISEVDSANYQFDSSAGLLCRFVVSTRPLRDAIIRRTLHEVFT